MMRKLLKRMPGAIRTAVVFLAVLGCLVTASAASVRAEEDVGSRPFEETEEKQGLEGTGELAEEKEDVREPQGDGSTEEETGSDTFREEAAAKEEERELDRIPAGRKYISGNRGTARVVDPNGIMLFSVVGSDCTITPGTAHSYGDWSTTEFQVSTEEGEYMGYCAQPSKPTPSGVYQVAELDNDRIKMALMFGADGPWAEEASELFGGTSNPYPYIHAMIGVEYTGETEGLTDLQVTAVVNALNELMASERTEMPIFREYKVYIAYNDNQDIVWLEHPGPQVGNAWLHKSPSVPSMVEGNSCYSLKGAVYGIYSDAACTIQAGSFTTDENGECASVELEEGDYWVKEIRAPKGYLKNIEVYAVHVNAGEDTSVYVEDIPGNKPMGVEIIKTDQDTGAGIPQGGASLAGAQFTVKYYAGYYEEGNLPELPARTWVLETKESTDPADGSVKSMALLQEEYKVSGDAFYTAGQENVLPLGTISIEETKAPEGYLLEDAYIQAEGGTKRYTNKCVVQITMSDDGNAVSLTAGSRYHSRDKVIRGGVRVQKRDYESKKAAPQGEAVLDKAVIQIVNENPCPVIVDGKSYQPGEVVSVLTLDKAGTGKTAADLLPYGTYKLVEKTAPSGYLNAGITERIFSIKEQGKIVDMTGQDQSVQDQVIRGGVKIQKRDFDTKDTAPQGGATLEKAVFTITTLNENPVIVNGKTCQKGDVAATVRTNAAGLAQTSGTLLPYGTYRIMETGAPSGYLGTGVLSQEFSVRKNGEIVDLTDTEHSIQNKVKRGDFEMRKISSETQGTMARVSFRLTSVTTGESHVFTTDQNGYYSSCADWNPHSFRTNQGGEEDGLWFGMDGRGNSAPIDDKKGALPYDTYKIEEIPSDANKGKIMFQGSLVIYKNNTTVLLGNIENKDPDESTPAISTTARNEATGNHYAPTEQVTVIDTVLYSGLKEGQEYRLRCIPMRKSSGRVFTDREGKPVTTEKIFTAAAASGIVETECSFDASAIGGEDIVLFEELYQGEKKIAEHKDPADEGQTVHFVKIETRAADPEAESNVVAADEEITIVDTVFYENLKPGQEYILRGKLIDKEAGQVVLDAAGKEVTAEVKFVPEEREGSTEVKFVFDGSHLQGRTLVAFESLEKNGRVYAVHADIEDESQTVYIPEIRTQAWDVESKIRNAGAKEHVTIVDEVSYTNLKAGTEYRVKGTLMDKESGEALRSGGRVIDAETVFVPEEDSGAVEVKFEFDGSGMAGKTTVAFESLTQDGREVAAHEDINFAGQTICFPQIKTKAGEKETGSQEVTGEKEITVIDTIYYENLLPGTEYTVRGILMDKTSGKPLLIRDQEVTAETCFIPDEKNGTAEAAFTFDPAGLEGMELVVFEKLYAGDAEIASHEDLKDQGQSIRIYPPEEENPSIKTGDFTGILPAAFAAVLSAGMAAGVIMRKRRRKQRRRRFYAHLRRS